jgi:orotate phosphoribosyltransferase
MKDPHSLTSFISSVWKYGILQFGDFTLKSGRISPYFFNAGKFDTGDKTKVLAIAFAETIQETGLEFDVLFGPSYKGIPLCVATSIALSAKGKYCGFAFNRKEEKDHGDGGLIVGHILNKQRVLLLDDVMTSGISLRESADTVKAHGGIVVGCVIILDRQERPTGDMYGNVTALQHTSDVLGVPIYSIMTLSDIAMLCPPENQDAMEVYRRSMCL